MSVSTIIGIIIIGVLAGMLSGLVGIGGGIVIVPSLVLLYGLSQQTAQGTTLALLSIPVSLIATINYYKKGFVDWKIALLLAVGFVIGGYFGSKIALNLPVLLIKKVFAVVMILIAVKYLFFEK